APVSASPDTGAAPAEAEIGGVSFEVTTLRTAKNPEKIQALVEAQKALERDIDRIKMEQSLCERQQEMLAANIAPGAGSSGQPARTLAEITELADYYLRENTRLDEKKLELKYALEEAERRREATNIEIGSDNIERRSTGELSILIKSAVRQTVRLDIGYNDTAAGWTPYYDLRVEEDNATQGSATQKAGAPLRLVAKGRVRQSTGEHWEGVALTLSSGSPRVNIDLPELETWYVRAESPSRQSRARASGFAMMESAKMSAPMDMGEAAPQELVQELYRAVAEAEVSEQQTSVEFSLPLPAVIETGGEEEFQLRTHELTAKYRYISVPKLDSAAYLMAEVKGWERLNLLYGDCNLFLNGIFIGRTVVDPRRADEGMEISLGADSAILVKRERGRDSESRAFIGTTAKAGRQYELTVRNTKGSAIELELVDQLPVSTSDSVRVEMTESGAAEHDKDTGKLTWKITLSAGESQSRKFAYTVTYPKNSILYLD
ncbi:MAG: DUF4139 domain-containing protein, partial [Clostridiaceae bacterium]|nr:DUF4139 domain-containing protein [Clostridiaceae bacterium]